MNIVAVETIYGKYMGKKDEFGGISFKGIPYAKPPIGDLRWKAPANLEPSDKIFEAYEYGKVAIQVPTYSEKASYSLQGEDCLLLNIWTSDIYAKNKPVMVFIHGGAFGWGGTTDPLYDGQNFVRRRNDIILVTIQYRLNNLGFLDLSSIGGKEYEDSANLGLLDQIQALKWVKENIANFGGDPNNVTIFGESCGGTSVTLLMTMPKAKGLFQKVIAQSGCINITQSESNREILAKFLEVSGKNTIKELLAMGEEEMRYVNFRMEELYNLPIRDGRLIPKDPYQEIIKGCAKGIKLLIGSNADEWNYWKQEIPDFDENFPQRWEKVMAEVDSAIMEKFLSLRKGASRIRKVLDFANDIVFRLPAIIMAENQSKHADTYMYYFKQPSAIEGMGACHAVELAYVFYNLNATIFTGENPSKLLADRIHDAWVNFATTGNPSTENTVWPKYDKETRTTMIIDADKWEVINDPGAEDRKLLQDFCRNKIDLH